jgi:hypothetical protein
MKKAFSWSYSTLTAFENCPRRHWHYDVLKDVVEPKSEKLLEGDTLHKQAAAYLSRGVELPAGRYVLKRWCDKIVAGQQVLGGKLLVEQKLAITEGFLPCAWFGDTTWFRAIGDVITIAPPVALIGDWKTGKILEDSYQLGLSAQCVFAHYPDVQKVRSEFFWLTHDSNTAEVYSRDSMVRMWANLWPRIEALKNAYEKEQYPANPGGLCKKYCAVTTCPHCGEKR